MIITINRTKKDAVCQTGVLSFNGQAIGVTISRLDNDSNFPAIPVGTYQGEIRYSNHFGQLMIHFNFADGDYMIHWGNEVKDSEGCELVGMDLDPNVPDFIDSSKGMENKLWIMTMEALKVDREISIVITENYA
jgi:hypothetical protein